MTGVTRVALVVCVTLLLGACTPRTLWTGHDPSRTRAVSVWERGSQQWVTIGSHQHERHDAVAFEALTFSDDGKHYAYPVRDGQRWRLIVDGQAGSTWDGIGVVLFGGNRRLAYTVLDGKAWRVVVDGKPFGPLQEVYADGLRFAADGKRLAFVARVGGAVRVNVDGVWGPAYDGVSGLRFDASGRRFAYVARRKQWQHVVLDGVEQPSFQRVTGLAFSETGGRFAYLGRADVGHWHLIVDGCVSRPYDALDAPVPSRDGAHWAVIATEAKRSFVVVDGWPTPRLGKPKARTLTFSPDGQRLAYVVSHERKRHVVVDGKRGPRFDDVSSLTFSADGARFGYVGRRARVSYVVLEGERTRAHRAARVHDLWVGAAAGRVAYLLQYGEEARIVHGERRWVVDIAVPGTLVLTKDGRHWGAVVGVRGERQLFIGMDGVNAVRVAVPEIASALLRIAPEDGGEGALALSGVLREWVTAELANRFGD